MIEAPAAPVAPPSSRARPGVPFLPAIFIAAALLFLGVAVGAWWANREADPSAVDIGFYDDMTTHHLQAIEMARTYERAGEDPGLVTRAQEIEFAQIGDVRVMQDALGEWGETGTPDIAMEWMGEQVATDEMAGYATPEQLEALEAASGRELDDQFTQLMINHHAGGLHMAEYAADNASIGSVKELAGAMAATQQMEIDELNHARQALGLPIHHPTT